jgi:hypothetical protein
VGYLVEYLVTHGYRGRIPDPRDGPATIVRRTEKGWLVDQTARHLVEKIELDWAERIGADKIDQPRDRLAEFVEALDFESTPRVGGVTGTEPSSR